MNSLFFFHSGSSLIFLFMSEGCDYCGEDSWLIIFYFYFFQYVFLLPCVLLGAGGKWAVNIIKKPFCLTCWCQDSLSSSFKRLIMIYRGTNLINLILCEVYWFTWICKLVVGITFGKFPPIISSNILEFCLLFLWVSSCVYNETVSIFPQVSKMLLYLLCSSDGIFSVD